MLSISIIKSEKEVILYFLFPLATGLIYRLIKKQVSDKKAQCITLQSERKIHEEGNYPISTEQSEASIQHEH